MSHTTQLRRKTQGKDSLPVVFISPDLIRYDKTAQGTELRAIWNDISQRSDIPKFADVQGNRLSVYIDLYSLPSVSAQDTNKIKPELNWRVEGRPNEFQEIKVYAVDSQDPDNQLPAVVIFMSQTEELP